MPFLTGKKSNMGLSEVILYTGSGADYACVEAVGGQLTDFHSILHSRLIYSASNFFLCCVHPWVVKISLTLKGARMPDFLSRLLLLRGGGGPHFTTHFLDVFPVKKIK